MTETHTEQTGSFKRIPDLGHVIHKDRDADDPQSTVKHPRDDWDPYTVWRSRIRRS